MRKLSTGEPCAGEPLARFGGRGGSGKALLYPYNYGNCMGNERAKFSFLFPFNSALLNYQQDRHARREASIQFHGLS